MNRSALFSLGMSLAVLVSGCGGGGGAGAPGGGALPAVPTTPQMGTANVALVIPVIAGQTASAARKPRFISASTQQAWIAVSPSNGSPNPNLVVDLSPSSSACHTSGTARTCTFNVSAPLGADTFSITTLDANGHVLGIGSVSQNISSAGQNGVTLFIDATVNGYASFPAFSSVPADGVTRPYGFVLNAVDFDNNPIVNGTTDPFSNPITVTLTENGGSGYAQLLKNGIASGTSTTLTKSSDTIAVQYTGKGSAGYFVGMSFAASGMPTKNTVLAPMYLTTPSSHFVSPNLSLGGTGSASFTIVEANAPSTTVFSVTPANCSGVATISSVTTVNGTGVFSVTGVGTGSCTVTVSDGSVNLTFGVFNNVPTPTPSPTPSPTPTPAPTASPTSTPTPTPTPTPAATNPPLVSSVYVNGNGSSIETFPIAAVMAASPGPYTAAAATTFTTSSGLNAYFALDAAHNMIWSNNGAVYGYPASSTGTVTATMILSPTIGSGSGGITVDGSGNVYVAVNNFPTQYIEIFPFGSTSPGAVITTTLQNVGSMAVDASGYMYVIDRSTHQFDVLAPVASNAGSVSGTIVRTISAGLNNPWNIALDSSARPYVLDPGNQAVYLYAAGTTNAAQSTPIETIAGGGIFPSIPEGIAIDANNYVYIADINSIVILTPNSITTSLGGTLNYPSQGTISGASTLLTNAAGIAAH